MPSNLLAFDKLVHAVAFAIGGLFLAIALKETTRLRGKWLFAAIVLGIGLFGAYDEIHQMFTPGRTGADFKDWLADMIGGSLAAFVYCFRYGRNRSDTAGSAGENPPTP